MPSAASQSASAPISSCWRRIHWRSIPPGCAISPCARPMSMDAPSTGPKIGNAVAPVSRGRRRSMPAADGYHRCMIWMPFRIGGQMKGLSIMILVAAGLAACSDDAPQALGTLEYDRITLPAPAAERIVSIDVREGERVAAGRTLLRLDVARTRSTTAASQAEAQRQREVLAELEAGPRSEAIAQARAQLAAAEASARRSEE